MPPCVYFRVGFICFLMIFIFSIKTLSLRDKQREPCPLFPFSLPVITITVSFFFMPKPIFPYKTSGANEIIFVNSFHLSSLATGPKILVPTGSPCALIRTTAFWSKRIYDPSGLLCSFLVRTTTAFATVPFLILLSGKASFTLTTTMSPSLAYRLWKPPSTFMHCTFFAPELSATSSILLN